MLLLCHVPKVQVPHFQCRTGNECWMVFYECDYVPDCRDNSDEDHCEEKRAVDCELDFQDKMASDGKPLQSFQCDNGMCILGCRQCDGVMDCADNSDESGCNGTEVIPPCQ
ncbi:low-density lipoprotein receptor-related protein 8-like [Patiria miniata]|uniref:Uncharacterized protein n=1 Tax=Patiria miniata TaxID=46514 RepID=A0A914A4I0_PATMI|nr:low-density lipoprotein receptor-related protein 8-like [Patiria miniata]